MTIRDNNTADDLRDQVSRSRFLARRGDRPPSTELPGLNEVHRVMLMLCRAARSDFLELHDPTASTEAINLPADYAAACAAADAGMLRRGVRLRHLTTTAAPAEPDCPPDGTVGAAVRYLTAVPIKMTVVDRRMALLPLDPAKRTLREGALLVRDPAVIAVLHATHTALWAAAQPRPTAQLPVELVPVLDTLLAGFTDDTAARRLDLSPRTYRRRVAHLLRELGATSRTQAAAEIHRRGWDS